MKHIYKIALLSLTLFTTHKANGIGLIAAPLGGALYAAATNKLQYNDKPESLTSRTTKDHIAAAAAGTLVSAASIEALKLTAVDFKYAVPVLLFAAVMTTRQLYSLDQREKPTTGFFKSLGWGTLGFVVGIACMKKM